MKKMTVQQELNMLRAEVEELRKQKEKTSNLEVNSNVGNAPLSETKESENDIDEIIDLIKEAKNSTEDQIKQIIDVVKHDYDNISPISAVILFALGAILGNAISSKKRT